MHKNTPNAMNTRPPIPAPSMIPIGKPPSSFLFVFKLSVGLLVTVVVLPVEPSGLVVG